MGIRRNYSTYSLIGLALVRSVAAFTGPEVRTAMTTEECLAVLRHSGFQSITPYYSLLRRLRYSQDYPGHVREQLARRNFQRAIMMLDQEGFPTEARGLREYVEHILRHSSILDMTPLGRGQTGAMRVTLAGGIPAIFKPSTKTWKDQTHAWASQENSEVLAYSFGVILGVHVPVTVERNIAGISGSLQIWVPGTRFPTTEEIMVSERFISEKERAFRAFDYLINNKDRHIENYMVIDDEYILIDHGVSFVREEAPGYNGPYGGKIATGSPLPDRFHRALRDELTRDVIVRLLGGKVESEVIDLVQRRRQELLDYHDRALSNVAKEE